MSILLEHIKMKIFNNDLAIFEDAIFMLKKAKDKSIDEIVRILYRHGLPVARMEYISFFKQWFVYAIVDGATLYDQAVFKNQDLNTCSDWLWNHRGQFTLAGLFA